MFHNPDFMPFTPRRIPSLRAAVSNIIENWPPQAYREDHAVMRGLWPISPDTALLTDPGLIADMLVTRADLFERDQLQVRALAVDVNRDSLFFAEGGHWKWQRRAVAPAFRHEHILALVPTFARCAAVQADEWRRSAEGPIDVAPAMSHTTFSIILDAVLGEADGLDRARFLAALNPALATIAWRFLLARMGFSRRFPFPGSRKADEGARWLYEATRQLVADRRAKGGASKDIMSLLLSAKDPETGRVMSDAELISNLYTLMVAGHETAATALAWTLWILAKDQVSQERLRAEIFGAAERREIGPDDVERLTFTRQVLQESMRLYPPAIAIGRAPREDLAIGDYRFRKGEPILVATWCVHRHEKLWEDPTGFDPDRFAPEKAKARHRCAYLPFGAGPRICIGMGFAMTEMVVVLATLVRDFRFKPAPDHRIALRTNLTLRAEGGLPLLIEPL
jgi:cytochrome P450